MVPISYKASAPGTLMLLGEHSVLKDKHAIALAIDKRITITLQPRQDKEIIIHSALGDLSTTLEDVRSQKPFEFILATIDFFKKKLNFGFELYIVSEFSSTVGLGSSAAITVATTAVLKRFLQDTACSDTLLDIFQIAKTIVQEVQGVGSGADVAASVYGGMVLYQQFPPFVLKQLSYLIPLVVIYTGYKTPTPEVIQKVEALRQKHPNVFAALDEVMNSSTQEAVKFIEDENWSLLGEVMKIQQGIMNAFGVSTSLLNQVVDSLNNRTGLYGAKISGSGLGDCVIGLGEISNFSFPNNLAIEQVPVNCSLQGVCCG